MHVVSGLYPAVFIDKDGTLVEDVPYNVDPERIRLMPGAERLRELIAIGYQLVVISNQSGIARGYFDEDALASSVRGLETLLRRIEVPLASFYYCPHHPNGRVEKYRLECACRKPSSGLIERAAIELRLDLGRSWMVGDILDDVEAGCRAGCRTVHIDSGHETEWILAPDRMPHRTVANLGGAVDAILAAGRHDQPGHTIAPWQSARNILCVRLDTLGDVLMTTPAIRALKESHADRHITLLTSGVGAQVAALVPEIDDVIEFDAPWMKGRSGLGGDQAVIDELERREFDAAVLFSVYSQNIWASALLCRLAGIPLRLGHSRENPYDLLTDWVPEFEPESFVRHEVQRQVELVERIGVSTNDLRLSLTVSEKADDRCGGRLQAAGVDLSRPWVLIHPGSRAASRRYPPEMFAQAARTLVLEDGWQVCFSGSCDEMLLVEEIRSQMDAPSCSLAGPMELEELAGIISRAPLLITNNTGPAHIAAALGTAQVTIYAQTNPQHMPWHSAARVLKRDVACRYCYRSACPEEHHDCLRLIQPDEVVRAARGMMVVRMDVQAFVPDKV